MKVVVTQENLHKGLAAVSRVVGSRVSLPVLSNVLLQTEGGRLKISATDLEIGLTTWIGAKVEKEGSITVPSRSFSEFVASSGDDTITLELDKLVMKVKTDHSEANFRGIDAEEFPVVPTNEAEPNLTVSAPVFLQAIKQTIVAAATDDTRPVLAGLYFNWKEKTLRMAATDSYRLAEKRVELDKEIGEGKEVIVPSRCINELARVIASTSPDVVNLTVKDNQVLFSFSDTEIVSRLIDGKYPDYLKIVPEKMVTTAVIDTEALKSTLRTVSIFAREASNVSTMHFGPDNNIKMAAVASSLGDSNTSVSAEVDGEETEAKFNVKYLLDGVSVVGESKLEFGLSGQYQPGLIKGVGNKDFRYIIMPLKTD